MKQNQKMKTQIRGFIYTFLFTALIFTNAFAAATNRNETPLAGSWTGTFQTPGPSGLLELNLINTDGKWSGEVKIEGPGHKILTKPAQKIKVEEENLIFMIELVGAEITFTGKLENGKLSGGLEGVEDGKTVAMGSWEMARSQK